jgi:hypothetical protein
VDVRARAGGRGEADGEDFRTEAGATAGRAALGGEEAARALPGEGGGGGVIHFQNLVSDAWEGAVLGGDGAVFKGGDGDGLIAGAVEDEVVERFWEFGPGSVHGDAGVAG